MGPLTSPKRSPTEWVRPGSSNFLNPAQCLAHCKDMEVVLQGCMVGVSICHFPGFSVTTKNQVIKTKNYTFSLKQLKIHYSGLCWTAGRRVSSAYYSQPAETIK